MSEFAAYRMRPRFQVLLSLGRDEALEILEKGFEQESQNWIGKMRGNHAQIMIPTEKQKFWSPSMSLEFVETETEGVTKVYALLGPSPAVWTGFMAGYTALIFLFFVCSTLGYSQWSLKKSPWGFYMLPVICLMFFCWYALSWFGKRLAREQMDDIIECFFNIFGAFVVEENTKA